MKKQRKLAVIRMIAMCLVISFLLPTFVSATGDDGIEPYASDYLTSYNAYVCPMAWGKLEVWFTVTADDDMDDLGSLSVMIYESTDNENWTWVKTFLHEDNANMLGHNDFYYSSHVDYQGTIGRYYKAYVCIWAGRNGGGDSRYFWTSAKKATLFAPN